MFGELLRAKLAGICEVSDAQAARLEAHYELMSRWNRVLSLTSVRTLEDAVERHYCESVFAAIHLPEGGTSVADIGSGAGFPGIPMAVMLPGRAFVLIESHQRKAAFLKEASRDLVNVRVVARRAEDVREGFDWVVSRAPPASRAFSILPTRPRIRGRCASSPAFSIGSTPGCRRSPRSGTLRSRSSSRSGPSRPSPLAPAT